MKTSLELISKPTEVCLIDQYDKAYLLSDMYKDMLSYPKGVYSNNNIYPIIYDEGMYVIHDTYIKGKDIDVKRVYDDKIPVYNLKGKMILDPNKKIRLSKTPILPYIGLHLIAIWIIDYVIYRNSKIENLRSRLEYTFHNKVDDYFRMITKPGEVLDDDVKEKIISDTSNILEFDRIKESKDMLEDSLIITTLMKFMGKDIYHIYDVNIVKSYIEVSKFVDFRVYEWTRDKEGTEKYNNS